MLKKWYEDFFLRRNNRKLIEKCNQDLQHYVKILKEKEKELDRVKKDLSVAYSKCDRLEEDNENLSLKVRELYTKLRNAYNKAKQLRLVIDNSQLLAVEHESFLEKEKKQNLDELDLFDAESLYITDLFDSASTGIIINEN